MDLKNNIRRSRNGFVKRPWKNFVSFCYIFPLWNASLPNCFSRKNVVHHLSSGHR
jgi:hypothetical protein